MLGNKPSNVLLASYTCLLCEWQFWNKEEKEPLIYFKFIIWSQKDTKMHVLFDHIDTSNLIKNNIHGWLNK